MKTKIVLVSARPSEYQVTWRTRKLSTPKRIVKIPDDIPHYTENNVRTSALTGTCNDRIRDISLPYARRLRDTKRQYQNHLNDKRLKNLQATLDASHATIYCKLTNCDADIQKPGAHKKKKWSESDWRKHMSHIGPLATPQKRHLPKRMTKKKWKPLQKMIPHINKMSTLPPCKAYRRPSQEAWYKDPLKVSVGALNYQASDRIKEISKPVELDPDNPHCMI